MQALTNTRDMYAAAAADGYAIGGFIAYNMEMMQALVRAANRARSPILLQSSAQAVDYAGASYLQRIASVAAEEAEVPISLHLDHGFTPESCRAAVDAGFNSVMIDVSRFDLEENIRVTREIVEYAHDHGVVVEGELGSPENDGHATDPAQVAEYVERTGVDSLAIVAGNSHGQMQLSAPPVIDFDLIERVAVIIPDTPLVLHALTIVPEGQRERYIEVGGELDEVYMVSEQDFSRAARMQGMAKINIGISLKLEMMTAVRRFLRENPRDFDPRHALGAGREAIEDLVVEHFGRLGSVGKAERSRS